MVDSRAPGLDDGEAEQLARSALGVAASALNWLDGSEWEELAHRELDTYGKEVRTRFSRGCMLTFVDGRYEHRCPVAIGHKRIGFSVGMLVKRAECSICGEDPSECPHFPSKQYSVIASVSDDGRCSICNERDCSEHSIGETYMAYPVRVILEADIEDVSLVGRPMQPDARLLALPIDLDSLKATLGSQFEVGMEVACSECLSPCGGLERPFG